MREGGYSGYKINHREWRSVLYRDAGRTIPGHSEEDAFLLGTAAWITADKGERLWILEQVFCFHILERGSYEQVCDDFSLMFMQVRTLILIKELRRVPISGYGEYHRDRTLKLNIRPFRHNCRAFIEFLCRSLYEKSE